MLSKPKFAIPLCTVFTENRSGLRKMTEICVKTPVKGMARALKPILYYRELFVN